MYSCIGDSWLCCNIPTNCGSEINRVKVKFKVNNNRVKVKQTVTRVTGVWSMYDVTCHVTEL